MPIALPKIRDDLTYSPDHESPGYTFVKCSIRNDFFRFNDIQITLMQAMDGQTSIEELIEIVGEEFEVEMSPDEVRRFESRLSERFLLDIASYQTDDAATSKKIKKELKKSGFLYRVKARDENNPEANLFALGMQQALGQNPLQAASYFQAILEINPNNARARQVLDCIHRAFLSLRRKEMAHGAIGIPLVNPEKFLGVLDRWVGKITFSWVGVALLLLILPLELSLVVDLFRSPDFTPSSFTAADGIAFFAVLLVFMLVHELGHAFASKHYGGHPNELGLQLIFGIIPAAYCDASDTYLFKNPRHKIICFLSGIPAQAVATTILLAILLTLDPTMPGWTGVGAVCFYSVAVTYQDLNPLGPLDGYYALGDYLRIINLRDRSFEYVWHSLAHNLFGVESDVYRNTPPRERRIFFVYGILAMAFTVFWITIVMLNVMVPLAVEYLGLVGVFLVFFYLYGKLKSLIQLLLIPFVRFLIRERKTVFSMPRSAVYAVLLAGCIWILNTQDHVHVEGSMVIESARVSPVISAGDGLIERVHVREGDKVKAGALLFSMESEDLNNQVARSFAEVAIAELELSMLEAGARPEEISLVVAKHQAHNAKSSQMSNRFKLAQAMRTLDVGTDANLLEARGEAIHATSQGMISESEIDLLRAGARTEEIVEATAAVVRAKSLLATLQQQREALAVRAPIAGVVTTPDVGLLQGRWVPEGAALCVVEDDTHWRVRIRPGLAEPIEGLGKGDRVMVRAFGRANEELELKVQALLPPTDEDSESIVIETTAFAGAQWRSGLGGRARIYGPKRSFAYRWIALPIIQVVNLEVVPLFKDV